MPNEEKREPNEEEKLAMEQRRLLQERMMKANTEISEILKKYNLTMQVEPQIILMPIQRQ
jgi:hypothetical protein